MADLFDMRIGGAGWHLTSHLIAIAALFVACFAITGYITFRDDSVPGTALKDEAADVAALTADSLTVESAGDITLKGGKIVHEGATTTDIDGDLSAKTTVTKYDLIDGSMIKYRVALSLNGLVASATDNDIIGATADAASTIVNLPTDFVLQSGQIRNSVATGETSVYNLVISSTDNQAEDTAMDTDGTSLTLYSDLNGNSVSTNFEPFVTVPLEAAPSTMRYLYLTNSGTDNTATTAGELVVDLVGYINNNSITTAVAMPLARRGLRTIIDWNSALTLNQSDSGCLVHASDASAGILTLPAVLAGFTIDISIGIAQTGDTHITVPGGYFLGSLNNVQAGTGTENTFTAVPDGNSNDFINLDSDAKGRLAGGFMTITCDGTNWHVSGRLIGSGTVATPFADAES